MVYQMLDLTLPRLSVCSTINYLLTSLPWYFPTPLLTNIDKYLGCNNLAGKCYAVTISAVGNMDNGAGFPISLSMA